MELKELIDLLAKPEELKSIVSGMRLRADLSEEEQGFLILYDRYNGNAPQIETYLNQTRDQIVSIPKKDSGRQLFYRVAASIIVIFGTAVFFVLNRTNTLNVQKPLSQSVSEVFKEPGIPILMGKETAIEWAPLMFAIDKESAQKALTEWQKLHKVAPKNDTVIYFGGIVHMNLERTARARKLFQKNAGMESVFADRSVYFLSQISKKEGNFSESKHLLYLIKNTSDMDLKPFVLEELHK